MLILRIDWKEPTGHCVGATHTLTKYRVVLPDDTSEPYSLEIQKPSSTNDPQWYGFTGSGRRRDWIISVVLRDLVGQSGDIATATRRNGRVEIDLGEYTAPTLEEA